MRRAARTDANQQEVIDAMRKCGASVQDLSAVGKGVPDLLVGLGGKNVLVEVKDGSKIPSKQKLTKDQEQWHSKWKGVIHIVRTVDEAIDLVRQMREWM